jgi:hypothetical protein
MCSEQSVPEIHLVPIVSKIHTAEQHTPALLPGEPTPQNRSYIPTLREASALRGCGTAVVQAPRARVWSSPERTPADIGLAQVLVAGGLAQQAVDLGGDVIGVRPYGRRPLQTGSRVTTINESTRFGHCENDLRQVQVSRPGGTPTNTLCAC